MPILDLDLPVARLPVEYHLLSNSAVVAFLSGLDTLIIYFHLCHLPAAILTMSCSSLTPIAMSIQATYGDGGPGERDSYHMIFHKMYSSYSLSLLSSLNY
jgi:hypothetical protein